MVLKKVTTTQKEEEGSERKKDVDIRTKMSRNA